MEAYGMAGHLIRRLHQISTAVFTGRVQEAGFDLTSVQFAAMDAIETYPGIDQAGVAARIAYDRATIGGVIDRLVQKRLVARTISQRDRRAREVRLTKAGQETLDRIRPVVRELQEEILAGLTKRERSAFLDLARKTIEHGSDAPLSDDDPGEGRKQRLRDRKARGKAPNRQAEPTPA